MPNFIPPARIRQEDELFINSLAHEYQDKNWSYETLCSITADAMRMVRHLSSRYSDPTCMELNAEELEAEGRRKFIEQITCVKVLTGLPQKLHEGDLVVSFNGIALSGVEQLMGELAQCSPGDSAVIEYLRWPKPLKKEEQKDAVEKPKRMKQGTMRFILGGSCEAKIAGVEFSEMTDELRGKGVLFEGFNPLSIVVKEVDSDEPLIRGRAPEPPSRVELFSWLKCCANNHIRGIVHRCRFTVRRTGRKVPSKDSKTEWNRSFKPEVSLEAASEDDHLNRAVERAASIWDSHAVSEFDEDMGASRYSHYFSERDTLSLADISVNLRISKHDPDFRKCVYLNLLANRYRSRGCTIKYAYAVENPET